MAIGVDEPYPYYSLINLYQLHYLPSVSCFLRFYYGHIHQPWNLDLASSVYLTGKDRRHGLSPPTAPVGLSGELRLRVVASSEIERCGKTLGP